MRKNAAFIKPIQPLLEGYLAKLGYKKERQSVFVKNVAQDACSVLTFGRPVKASLFHSELYVRMSYVDLDIADTYVKFLKSRKRYAKYGLPCQDFLLMDLCLSQPERFSLDYWRLHYGAAKGHYWYFDQPELFKQNVDNMCSAIEQYGKLFFDSYQTTPDVLNVFLLDQKASGYSKLKMYLSTDHNSTHELKLEIIHCAWLYITRNYDECLHFIRQYSKKCYARQLSFFENMEKDILIE